MPPGPTLIGTDLSDDHPVSFVFDGQLALANGQLHDPSILPEEVKLDRNGMVQCTSCHNPHGTSNPKFLVRTRSFSQLCRSCHDKSGWGITSHSISSATWNGAGTDPWFHTPFDTVAENACENCHDPHSAGSDERILNYFFEEDICFACHNGNVASTNIEGIFSSKPHIHPIFDTVNVHDGPREDPLTMPKHVECMDCHNPHWANSSSPPGGPPAVSGRNQGVTGVSESGQSLTEAANLYEICFKCHADNNVKTVAPVNRLIFQLNTRLEFAPSNPGYHPVMAPGANPNVPSLRPPLTENSIIYCTDCHNNNDLSGPRGPHGSTNHFLLERQYVHQDFVEFDESQYAMCFKCHRWDTGNSGDLRDSETFEHKIHMENADASCFTCHDPHGVSSTQGNSLNNAHLINFNLDIVRPWTGGPRPDAPTYESLGQFRGRCTLECHGEQHGSGSSSRDNNGWREYPR
jgi:predicted CXXCH cytochrome family protein